jgi:hypothetical protein
MSRPLAALISGLFFAASIPDAAHAADAAHAPIYSCTFAAGGWSRGDWLPVKHPAVPHFGDWVQQEGRIANEVPRDATPSELRGKRAAETYSNMLYKEPVTGNATITSTMAFADKTAPLILLVPELPKIAQGQKEFGEHYEIIIYDQGVNIWRYFANEGKLTFRRAAFATFPLQKDTKYTLEVKKSGKTLTVSVAGHTFGYFDDALPDPFYVGITGCEGLNYFYDFAVRR